MHSVEDRKLSLYFYKFNSFPKLINEVYQITNFFIQLINEIHSTVSVSRSA